MVGQLQLISQHNFHRTSELMERFSPFGLFFRSRHTKGSG